MTQDKLESFVARWSRRKLAAARESAAVREAPPAEAPVVPAGGVANGDAPVPAVADGCGGVPRDAAAASELPPVDSLTFDSDFTGFLRPGVDPGTRQAALRKLLRDPRFNAMDGLDVYIDDYTKPAPLDPALARRLADALFTPTRVNEQGHAEDVPPEERVASVAQRPADTPVPVAHLAATDDLPSDAAPPATRAPVVVTRPETDGDDA